MKTNRERCIESLTSIYYSGRDNNYKMNVFDQILTRCGAIFPDEVKSIPTKLDDVNLPTEWMRIANSSPIPIIHNLNHQLMFENK